MGKWYARPVLFVTDVEKSTRFYVNQLGFTEAWRHVDEDRRLVAQVDRAGCELILSSQWPGKIGHGLIFISLERDDVPVAREGFEKAGVHVKEGWWGYPLMIIEDPDGNELYFPCAEPGVDGDEADA